MTKDKVLKLLSANKTLLEEIEKIIGRQCFDMSIVNGLKLPWAFEDGDGMIYYARHEGDDIYDYEGYQVCLSDDDTEFSMGESDDLTYVMGYDESEYMDSAYILILDNNNKESLTIDE